MSEEPEIECSICGRDGGPFVGCGLGCNGEERFKQSRAYTLSDERAGRAPKVQRYGLGGQVGPSHSSPLWAGAENPTKQ